MTVIKTPVALPAATLASIAFSLPANAASTPHCFANCTAMHRVFPHGVGQFGARHHTSGTPVTDFALAPRW
jgi:hypothetical protein